MAIQRKRMRTTFILAALFVLGVLLAGCGAAPEQGGAGESGEKEAAQPLGWEVPAYEYTDQDGKPFGSGNLKGEPYLVDLIFTRCPDVCPPMTANMAQLQNEMKEQGAEVEIVSFSVDPEHDQPQVLKRFAKSHNADLDNWHFLTGYGQQEIEELALKGFKSPVTKREPQSKDDPLMINHPVSFFLVDGEGKVYERYDGMDPDSEKIIRDIKKLKGE